MSRKIYCVLIFFVLSLQLFGLNSLDSQNTFEYYNKTIENAFNHWNNSALLKILPKIKDNDKISRRFFLLTKLYFYLTLIVNEKNGHIFSKLLVNEDVENPGYLNLVLKYGEKALSTNKDNLELLYYITFSSWKLIRSPATFFKYRDTMIKYEHKMVTLDKTNIYTLLFEANFHLTFSVLGGAIRKKGNRARQLLLQLYPDSVMANNILSYIYYKEKYFNEAIKYSQKSISLNPDNLVAQNRLVFLQGFFKNFTINKISIAKQNEISNKIFFRFMPTNLINDNNKLTPNILLAIEKSLSKYRVIQNISFDYQEQTDDKVNIFLEINSVINRVININVGQELVFDKDDIITGLRVRNNLIPPVFYFQDPSLFNTGILSFKFYTVSFLKWNAFLNINLFETIDINIGVDAWVLPVLYSLKDKSKTSQYTAKINYMYFEPSLGIAKYFTTIHSNLSLSYKPKIYFLLPDSIDTQIDNIKMFIYPPKIFVEHKLKLDFLADFINLLEFGWVREGFKVEASVEWTKMTPDTHWGYSDFLTVPSNLSFTFSVYGEYSKFVRNIFYLSIAGQYKGGINLYKLSRVSIGKGTLGTPFGYEIKVHGFDRDKYLADHMFLLNTLFGFKTSKYFHLGLYYDCAAFFEREANSYISQIAGSNYYFNIIMGFGSFFKWTPGYFFDIIFEASFGLDVGNLRINGPVLGLYLQKTFMLDYSKLNKKRANPKVHPF